MCTHDGVYSPRKLYECENNIIIGPALRLNIFKKKYPFQKQFLSTIVGQTIMIFLLSELQQKNDVNTKHMYCHSTYFNSSMQYDMSFHVFRAPTFVDWKNICLKMLIGGF